VAAGFYAPDADVRIAEEAVGFGGGQDIVAVRCPPRKSDASAAIFTDSQFVHEFTGGGLEDLQTRIGVPIFVRRYQGDLRFVGGERRVEEGSYRVEFLRGFGFGIPEGDDAGLAAHSGKLPGFGGLPLDDVGGDFRDRTPALPRFGVEETEAAFVANTKHKEATVGREMRVV
jgi:hypothetical protein